MAKQTYQQFMKSFKFRAKKAKEAPTAYISARGKAMGKAWRDKKSKADKKTKK